MLKYPHYYYYIVLALINCSGHAQAKKISGLPVKEVITTQGRTYTLTCTIECTLPIIVKRTGNGTTDYFIIRYAGPEDAQALLAATSHPSANLKKYMPLVCKRFGTDLATTSKAIAAERNEFFPEDKLYLCIFYKPSADAPEILIGQVGCHSYEAFRPRSAELMYWRVDHLDARVYGFVKPLIKMFVWYVLLNFQVDSIVMVCKKENKESKKVAIYLGAHKTNRPHQKWAYEGLPEESDTWVVTAKEFFENYE